MKKANEHLERRVTSCVSREMQTRHQDTPTCLLERPKSRPRATNGGRTQSSRCFICCCWECKVVTTLENDLGSFLQNISTLLPHSAAIMLFAIYPRELKSQAHPKPAGRCLQQLCSYGHGQEALQQVQQTLGYVVEYCSVLKVSYQPIKRHG